MKRLLILTLVTFLGSAAVAAAAVDGSWTASASPETPGRIHLSVRYDTNNMTAPFPIARFSGLTVNVTAAEAATPVQFEARAEAGTIVFDGTFRRGKGAGHFTFTPDPAYRETLARLGVPGAELRRDGERELFAFALYDVSTRFIREMQAEGYRVSAEKYLAMRLFNITPELVRELRTLGYDDIPADELIGMGVHKVTPDYVREMRATGRNFSLSDLVGSRIHGATPQFADKMRQLGYGSLDHDELVSFRIHGVTPEFITQLRELGYDNIPAHDLIAMRIHRVTPEYIRELKAAGYSGIPVRKLIDMRIHRIDAKFIDRMDD